MKTLLLVLCFFLFQIGVAQRFSDYFEDKTLRIDYIFAGNQSKKNAYVHQLVRTDGWHGRKGQLNTTPIQGNGQMRVKDAQTKQLIYVLPFSSLFQEWLTLNEAKSSVKSFENSYLIPFPKNDIVVEVVFFDENRREELVLQHTVKPNDILIKKGKQNASYQVIHQAKVAQPIKVAIVAEGYQVDEMDVFLEYAYQTLESMWKHEVFAQYKDAFEIVAVFTPSKDSGITQPSKSKWLDTAISSHFDTFYFSRYLTTPKVFQLHQLLENIPYQHIIILANTEIYGGGGILNSYTITTTKNLNFAPVVVHEFGHSFGGLADEYFYENDIFDTQAADKVEPWEKNITSLVDFVSKWKHLVAPSLPIPTPHEHKKGAVGAYEGLKGNGLYIPTLTCRMKINNTPDFCPVCSNALEEMIQFYTSKEN